MLRPEHTQNTVRRAMYGRKTEICRFVLGSALHMHERHEAEEVSPKFLEENIASAKLQAKQSIRLRAPFAKTFHVTLLDGKHGRVYHLCSCQTICS